MAKITSIKLSSPELNKLVNTDLKRIHLLTCLEFHPLDIQMEMEYQLHLFLFDSDAPLSKLKFLMNWDEADFFETSFSKAGIIEHVRVKVSACHAKTSLERIVTLSKKDGLPLNGIRVFGTLVPVISRATTWSNTYLFDLQLK